MSIMHWPLTHESFKLKGGLVSGNILWQIGKLFLDKWHVD